MTTVATCWTTRPTCALVDDMLTMAAGTGISVLFRAGDNGDEFTTLGLTSPDYPASSPWVTAVGGTTLEIGATGQRTGETGWSTDRSALCVKQTIGEPGCTTATLGTWLAPTADGGSAEVRATSTPSPPTSRASCRAPCPPAIRR